MIIFNRVKSFWGGCLLRTYWRNRHFLTPRNDLTLFLFCGIMLTHGLFSDTEFIKFPKRNTRFKIEDFFQTEVDDFCDGEFLFLSAKKVKTKSDSELLNEVESFDEYGWVISTWCYTLKCYHKIFICRYKQKARKSHYRIESMLAALNGCDEYAVSVTIEEFIGWIDIQE